MENNESLAYIDKTQKEKIIESIRKDIHIEQPNLASQNSQDVYLMGGQPGAGKSTSTKTLTQQYNKNIVLVDLDQYRKRHPNYKALHEKYGKESAEYTHEFASEIKEEIQKRAVDAKYNIIIDGTH